MIYDLDPDEAFMRAHEYRKSKGEFQNMERMLCPVSPLDFMEDVLDTQFADHDRHLWFHAVYPRNILYPRKDYP